MTEIVDSVAIICCLTERTCQNARLDHDCDDDALGAPNRYDFETGWFNVYFRSAVRAIILKIATYPHSIAYKVICNNAPNEEQRCRHVLRV